MLQHVISTNRKGHQPMTFSTTRLVGSRVLVSGTDIHGESGKTVLDASQWDEVNADQAFSQAEADFEKAAEEFFRPLVEAAEKLGKQVSSDPDPITYVVLDEGDEGTPARQRQLVKLTKDSVVLRLIEQGDTSRLVWVDGSLEIAEVLPVTVPAQSISASSVPVEDLRLG